MLSVEQIEQWLAMLAIPTYFVIIVTEMLISHFGGKKWYTAADTFNNLLMGGLNVVVDLLVRWIMGLAMLTFFFHFAFFHWEKNIVYWLILFILQDLAYYGVHLLEHSSRFFWAVHNTHHSAERMNFTVALRSSVFQPFYKFPFYIPLVLLGFEPMDILVVYALEQTYGFFVHTDSIKKLGFFEKFMVTPSHHRVHHARNPQYLDRNMAMVFIVWDKIFGTFTPEHPQQKPEYGLVTPPPSSAPHQVVFHEWKAMWKDVKKAPTLRDKLMYMFAPPGWSHDGSKKTSKQIRKELEEEVSQ
jgi:sterol desaturase/sphingolipid hydroxylase (fatty acid hydroxylase superfamily)